MNRIVFLVVITISFFGCTQKESSTEYAKRIRHSNQTKRIYYTPVEETIKGNLYRKVILISEKDVLDTTYMRQLGDVLNRESAPYTHAFIQIYTDSISAIVLRPISTDLNDKDYKHFCTHNVGCYNKNTISNIQRFVYDPKGMCAGNYDYSSRVEITYN